MTKHAYKIPAKRSSTGRDRRVVLVEPSETIMTDALTRSRIYEDDGQVVYMMKAQREQLRLCLYKVDGHRVAYREIEGDALNSLFSEYEITLLTRALDRLSTPTEKESADFLASARPYHEEDDEETTTG